MEKNLIKQNALDSEKIKNDQFVTVCSRCGFEVFPSAVEDYEYQCFFHDEDLYSIETKVISQDEYLNYLAKHFNCSKEEDIYKMNGYRKYVQENQQDYTMSLPEFCAIQNGLSIQKM